MKTFDTAEAVKSIAVLTVLLGVSTFLMIVFHDFVESHRPKVEESVRVILKQVLPGAAEFKPVFDEQDQVLYYEAFSREGRKKGYGFIFSGLGMWGEIRYSGGLDLDFRLTGVKILKQEETPGLGSRIEEPWFQEQFKGLAAGELEFTKHGGKIDGITGVTTTCEAVVEAIKGEMTRIAGYAGG
jgi:electron transport complex protein RnfG